MSNVSVCVGPPVIHSKLQCRRRFGSAASLSTNAGNQPLALEPSSPSEAAFSQSRRDERSMTRPPKQQAVMLRSNQPPAIVAERAPQGNQTGHLANGCKLV